MAHACSSAVPSCAMILDDRQIVLNTPSESAMLTIAFTRDVWVRDVLSVWICFHAGALASRQTASVFETLARTVRILRICVKEGSS